MASKVSPKTEKFDIRLSQQEEATIRQAASLLCTTPTNFIRQQALVAAQSVIHDQARLVLSDKQWQQIEQIINRPAKTLPNLKKKLSKQEQWNS